LGILGISVFFIGHILADLIWYSAVSLAVSRGKKFITDKKYRVIISGCGITLIGFGIYFSVTLL